METVWPFSGTTVTIYIANDHTRSHCGGGGGVWGQGQKIPCRENLGGMKIYLGRSISRVVAEEGRYTEAEKEVERRDD